MVNQKKQELQVMAEKASAERERVAAEEAHAAYVASGDYERVRLHFFNNMGAETENKPAISCHRMKR
jgi:hypothetical protein